jgi:predicted dehydrogenase
MVKIGVIGYGYWGPNVVRNFADSEETSVVALADQNETRLSLLKRRHPEIEVTTDWRDLLSNPNVDAVAIATPVRSHYELALGALESGKHVFVEKPFTETSEQAERLIEEAEKRSLVLHVDHTFIYTGAVRKMREIVQTGELGELYYYDSVRVNLGLFQGDVDVLWDLAVHDLSIMDFVFPGEPVEVSAVGVNHVESKPADIAYLTLLFENSAIAHLHVNWLAPVKVRRTLIGGSRKMIVYDDLEPSEKIKVYDKGITTDGGLEDDYQRRIGYRTGDMCAPQLEASEALRVEAQHFARCITHGERSFSDGHAGLRIVRILEAASLSMLERGRPVTLGWKGREI